MKILFFNQTGEISGAEVSLLDNLVYMKERGFETALAAPEDGPLIAKAVERGVEVHPLMCRQIRMSDSAVKLPLYLIRTLHNARCFRELCSSIAPDIVHGNTTRAGLIASLGAGTQPVVWHIRDYTPAGPLGRMVRLVASRSAAAIVANSNFIAANFSNSTTLKSKTRVVYNGFTFAERAGGGESFRSGLGVADDEILVAQVGHIGDIKNQKATMLAAAKALAENGKLRFVIVGKPLFKAEHERYHRELVGLAGQLGIEGRVSFAGYLEDVGEVYEAADIVVCPSKMEPFGRVAVEAGAAGKPVIASRVGGLPEIVEDGKTGVLIDRPDPEPLCEKILALAADPAECARLGENARLRVTSKFSKEQLVASLEEIYYSIKPL